MEKWILNYDEVGIKWLKILVLQAVQYRLQKKWPIET